MGKSTSPTRQMKRAAESRHERLQKKRKVRYVAVNPEMMGYMLIHGTNDGVTAEGLPTDVVALGWQYSPDRMCLLYLYGHESFSPVKEGEIIPLHEVTFKRKEQEPPSAK